MTNNQIIRRAAETAGIYTPEAFAAYTHQFGTPPLHTYQEWRRMGRQVKQGEHAVLICYLWKYDDGRRRADDAETAGRINRDADDADDAGTGDFYKAKSHLFDVSQTEPAGNRPAARGKTPAEIAAYNAMLAEQRRAAKAARARRAADRITAALAAPGWLALPEKAMGAQAPKAAPASTPTKAKRTREQITTAAAVKRICKSAARAGHSDHAGIMETPDGFLACDGFTAVLLNDDPGADLPRADSVFTAGLRFINEAAAAATTAADLPTVNECRELIAAHKGDRQNGLYKIGPAWVDPCKLLDLLQALPGCTAYIPADYKTPIYFKGTNGHGLLCPVVRKDEHPAA